MEIAKLCRRNLITVHENDELIKAAQIMRTRHVGYLVVVRAGIADVAPEPAGVLTDRDIVIKVVSAQADPRALTVGDVMTREPVVVAEGESINKALGEMRRIGVRRLPVVGHRGQLVGVLSLDDVVDALADELGAIAGSIRNEQRIEAALRQ
jgi:CBS domain-containing protein